MYSHQQGECDAVGISIQNGENSIYAVDVAFRRRTITVPRDTVMKVMAKARTAMSLYGYMTKAAEIILHRRRSIKEF
ncbi:MAG: hypothetical protein ACLVJO_02525 [[Clostridium] scindens]